jgi:hypothetical protein
MRLFLSQIGFIVIDFLKNVFCSSLNQVTSLRQVDQKSDFRISYFHRQKHSFRKTSFRSHFRLHFAFQKSLFTALVKIKSLKQKSIILFATQKIFLR